MNHNEPSNKNTTNLLWLFVYGTLKRGYWNHKDFCEGVLSVEEAVVRGRLYEFPSGIPILEVPEEDILALGTDDPVADVATQTYLAEKFASSASQLTSVEKIIVDKDWGTVYGEVMVFDDFERRLPVIDYLEDFIPGRSCTYRRVLVPALVNGRAVPVWLYANGRPLRGLARPLSTSRWEGT